MILTIKTKIMGEISRELKQAFKEDPWIMIKLTLQIIFVLGLSVGIIVLAACLGD